MLQQIAAMLLFTCGRIQPSNRRTDARLRTRTGRPLLGRLTPNALAAATSSHRRGTWPGTRGGTAARHWAKQRSACLILITCAAPPGARGPESRCGGPLRVRACGRPGVTSRPASETQSKGEGGGPTESGVDPRRRLHFRGRLPTWVPLPFSCASPWLNPIHNGPHATMQTAGQNPQSLPQRTICPCHRSTRRATLSDHNPAALPCCARSDCCLIRVVPSSSHLSSRSPSKAASRCKPLAPMWPTASFDVWGASRVNHLRDLSLVGSSDATRVL